MRFVLLLIQAVLLRGPKSTMGGHFGPTAQHTQMQRKLKKSEVYTNYQWLVYTQQQADTCILRKRALSY